MHNDETNDFLVVENYYRMQGKFLTDISKEMSKMLFMWSFILNTGGLGLAITFLGSSTISQITKTSIVSLIEIFALGIVLIFIAAKLEHIRFSMKGHFLDRSFDELVAHKIQIDEFIKKLLPSCTPCLDRLVPFLEYLSYGAFTSGLIFAVYILKHL